MEEIKFNLLDDKWIIVTYLDGHTDEIGLKDAFRDAHLIKTLSGEMPTQDLAIIRLMLAILYAVYIRKNENGQLEKMYNFDDAINRWNALWIKSSFDIEQIENYLNEYKDRFYLFHPTWPFYQANITVGTEYKSSKLNAEISESNNKTKLFTPMCSKNKLNLSFPKAARWLIHAQSFDDASAKQKNKENGSESMSVGWLGQIGPVFAEGNNLFETLMLNFVLATDEPFSDGKATWEKESVCCDERVRIPVPNSPIALLTLQSRRIKLIKNQNDSVTGYIVVGGDLVDANNALIEQMTMWIMPNNKNEWIPLRHNPSKSLWRDFSSLLVRSDNSDDGKKRKNPGIVDWLFVLSNRHLIPYNMLKFRSVGMKYDNKGSSIINSIDDSLSINVEILSRVGSDWNLRISSVVSDIELYVSYLCDFVKEICLINGYDVSDRNAKVKIDIAEKTAYYELDQPFRAWLFSINPESDIIENKMKEMHIIARNIIIKMGNEILSNCGESTMIGNYHAINRGHKINRSVFVSYRIFESRINKILR